MSIKLHPLQPAERHMQVMADAGVAGYHAWVGVRGTGRTTAIILNSIAKAIRQPGEPVELQDHGRWSHTVYRVFVDRVEATVKLLGLEHMHVQFTCADRAFLVFSRREVTP